MLCKISLKLHKDANHNEKNHTQKSFVFIETMLDKFEAGLPKEVGGNF